MGEYEPEDSRTVTQSTHQAPGEPPRTGPREDQARQEAERRERGESGTDRGIDGQIEQDMNTAALEEGRPLAQTDEGERGSGAVDPERLRRDADRPLGGE